MKRKRKVVLSIPAPLLEEVDELASEMGLDRSELIAYALLDYIRDCRCNRGRPANFPRKNHGVYGQKIED